MSQNNSFASETESKQGAANTPQPALGTAKKNRTKKTILFGFALIILILVSFMASLLLQVQRSSQQISQLATLEKANSAIHDMTHAANQRGLLLIRIAHNPDPTFRKEREDEFREEGVSFIKARDQYMKFPRDQNTNENFENMLSNAERVSKAQTKAIDAFREGRNAEATTILNERVFPAQKKIAQWLSLLIMDNFYQTHGLIDEMQKESQRALAIMSVLGLLGVSVAIAIALVVVRVTSRSEQEIMAASEEALSANKAKSRFLANMSHEIRTPLTAIIGFADAMIDGHQTPSENIEAINTISRNGRHLLGLINDILDLSKIESNKLTLESLWVAPLTILSEVESLMGNLAREKSLTFETRIDFPIPGKIQTDPTRLKQILLNLLSNAIKFTEEGKVLISCRFDRASKQLHFEVHDSGIGMSQDALAKLFQPFMQADASTTRKYGGTGLGLNISKRLIEMLGGQLHVSSQVGQGTVFRFSIACGEVSTEDMIASPDQIPVATQDEHAAPIPVLQGHILLAEDSPDVQRLVALYLKRTGAEVTLADNGQAAVELALAGDFDLILMDMQMPVMDGLEATQLLRQTGYGGPIVALTANAMQEDRDRYRAAGADDFLSKPIVPPEFYAILQHYLKPAEKPIAAEIDDEFKDLAQRFVLGLPDMMREISQGLQAGNLDQVRSTAHKLKGLGGSFGHPELTTMAATIENLARDNRRDELPSHVDILARRITQIAA